MGLVHRRVRIQGSGFSNETMKFSAQGSSSRAAEMCMNIGMACERESGGLLMGNL